MSSQKVVIPKWMINPEEVTVIEIPAELKSMDTVIIKPKLFTNANVDAETAEPNLLQPPHTKLEKLDVNINIPQWNEYFARAIKRRSAERQKELNAEEISDDEEDEEEEEEVDDDEDDDPESEVELSESELLLNYDYTHNAYNTNNNLIRVTEHAYNLQEENNNLSQRTTRHKLMKSPYSNVNKTDPNIIAIQGKRVEHVADLLDLVEKFEYSKIHRDLEDFQKARRKLVFSTTKLSTTNCFTIAPE